MAQNWDILKRKIDSLIMRLLYYIGLCLFLFGNKAAAQKIEEAKTLLTKQVDGILQGAVDRDEIPGAVIAIKQNAKIIYQQSYGFSQKYDIDRKILSSPLKMNTETLFDMASLTKVVGTTTSIMLLADRGLLRVDDPLSKYIPGFDTLPKSAITIRHLLTHTAGLYDWYPMFYLSSKRKTTYDLIHSLPLKYPVGKQRSYSDLGFTLLGEIVEKVSGLSLDEFQKQNIFIPLGMTHTLYNPLRNGRTDNIAATSFGNPYEKRMVYDSSLGFAIKEINPSSWNGWRNYVLKGEVNDGNAWYAGEGICGAAGLFSTIDDTQKLVDLLLDKGKYQQQQFISAAMIDSFMQPDQFRNGLGWMMDNSNAFMKDAPAGTFGHTGFTGTSIAVVPAHHLSVILLINRQNMGLLANGQYYNPNSLRLKVFKAAMDYAKSKRSN